MLLVASKIRKPDRCLKFDRDYIYSDYLKATYRTEHAPHGKKIACREQKMIAWAF